MLLDSDFDTIEVSALLFCSQNANIVVQFQQDCESPICLFVCLTMGNQKPIGDEQQSELAKQFNLFESIGGKESCDPRYQDEKLIKLKAKDNNIFCPCLTHGLGGCKGKRVSDEMLGGQR